SLPYDYEAAKRGQPIAGLLQADTSSVILNDRPTIDAAFDGSLAHRFGRTADESGGTPDVPVGSNSCHNPTRVGLTKEAQIPPPHTAMRTPTRFADVLIFSAAMGAAQWQTSRMRHLVRLRRNQMI